MQLKEVCEIGIDECQFHVLQGNGRSIPDLLIKIINLMVWSHISLIAWKYHLAFISTFPVDFLCITNWKASFAWKEKINFTFILNYVVFKCACHRTCTALSFLGSERNSWAVYTLYFPHIIIHHLLVFLISGSQ